MSAAPANRPVAVGGVLSAGGRLFARNLWRICPWILAAEIIGALPIAGAGGGLLNTDLGRLAQSDYLLWLLFSICAQTLLYALAVLKLAKTETGLLRAAIRSMPALFIGYFIYELLVIVGVGIALLLMLVFALLLGILPGVLVALIPLAPTAWISTALAFFAYPAVLERRGPLDSLDRSLRIAKSHWVHAAAVVSVPAIVLLAVVVLQDAMPVVNTWHAIRHITTQVSSQTSAAQLQDLMANLDAKQQAMSHPWWQAFTILLSALAWWYALAVCYVEYRTLSGQASLTAK